MKLNDLTALLRVSGADAWEVTDTCQLGWEFYFIRHALDQNRVKQVEHIQVKVYKKSEDGRSLGSASGQIPPSADEAEAERLIADLLLAASFVQNPVYTLNPPKPVEPVAGAMPAAADIAADFLSAVNSLPETATEDINSWELFVTENRRRLITSEGIDLRADYPTAMLEVVVNARDSRQEIELYRLFRSGTCDRESLMRELTEALHFGHDKLKAERTPALGTVDVVFSTSAARELYAWYMDRMNAAMKVRGMSDWELGQPIDPACEGDRFTVRTVTTLPHSDRNLPFDAEGAPVREITILEENVPRAFVGTRQFCQYLGVEDGFTPGNVVVSGGTADEQTLRSGAYLEAVEFSDFQVNPVTGDIAGEIRLAYWHDGDRVIPVSGGSVSGSMKEFVKTIRATRTQCQYNNLLLPALTRLAGVHVTGA